ncbi:MAG: hypothetical protein U0575_00455 [Phycisphaerales bacterium]
MRTIRPFIPLSLVTATSMCAPSVSADVTDALYINGNAYSYKVVHMPDLDQRRSTLPNNGSMYCVPTAAMNIFGYAANHGFPDVNPGPANWQSQSNYVAATLWINSMASFMGTDPVDGTTGGTNNGLDAFLATEPLLKRISRWRNSEYTPNAANLTSLACQGYVMSLVYGKYEQIGTHEGIPILDRVGGHAVTLTRSYRDPSQRLMRYRNPADDEAILNAQSPFVNTVRHPYVYTAYFGSVSLSNLRAMTALFESSGKQRIIDSYFGIRPLYGLSFSNSGDTTGGGTVEPIDPIAFDGSQSAILPSISISSALDVLDFGFDPDFEHALVIAKSNILVLPSRLRTLDLASGALSILTPAPQNLVRFDTDRHGHIYTFDTGNMLYQLGSDGTVRNVAVSTSLPTFTDVAVNDGDDSVWVLSVPQRKIVKLSQDLSQTLLTITVPALTPMSGDGLLVIDPTTGIPWFKTDANDKLYGVTVGAAGVMVATFTSAALTNADSISFGDSGELFVVGDGSVKVLKKATIGLWTIDSAHPFHGQPGGTRLAMLRNSTNFDPAIHSGPEWRNLTAAELEETGPYSSDCIADLNADEMVDGSDMGLLLAAWGASGGIADLDGDGTVGGSDIGLLLAAWGACD